MSYLDRITGTSSISDYLAKLLKESQDRLHGQSEKINTLDQEYRSLNQKVTNVIQPAVVRHDSDITILQDDIASVEQNISTLFGKVSDVEKFSTYISKVDYLYNTVIPEVNTHGSGISTNASHISEISKSLSGLSGRIDGIDNRIDGLPSYLANTYGFTLSTDFSPGSSWFEKVLSDWDVATQNEISGLSSRLGTVESNYMKSTKIQSYVSDYVSAHIPSETTLTKLTDFANSLPADVSTFFDWQSSVNTKLSTHDTLLTKNGFAIKLDSNGTTLSSYLDSIRSDVLISTKNALSAKWSVPEDISDLSSWMKDKIVQADILSYIPMPDLGNISAKKAINTSYTTSQSNKSLIGGISNFLSSVLTKDTIINGKFGSSGAGYTISGWVNALGKLDDTVWSHATHYGLPLYDYLNSKTDISNIANNAVATWVSSSLNASIDSYYYNHIRPKYALTPQDDGLTQMGSDMLSQALKTTSGDIVQMGSIVDISGHMNALKTNLDALTDTTPLNDINSSNLANYVKFITTIDGVPHSFDTYDDYNNFIDNSYRIPFVDADGHRYKLPIPTLYKYTNFVYHPASGSYRAYSTATDEDGNDVTLNGLPFYSCYFESGHVLVAITGWNYKLFYTASELNSFLSDHPGIHLNVADIWRYSTDDPSNIESLLYVNSDCNKNISYMALSKYGNNYINSKRDAIKQANLPHPLFTLIPSLSFPPGTSLNDVLSAVSSNISAMIPNTNFDRIIALLHPDLYATITALPTTVGILENNISSLRAYMAMQLAKMGTEISNAIDPDELSAALSQFGSNIQNSINNSISGVETDVNNLKSTVNSHSTTLSSLSADIQGLQLSVQDLSTGGFDMSSLWSNLTAHIPNGSNCSFGSMWDNIKGAVLNLKGSFAGVTDSFGNITSVGFNSYFDQIKIQMDGIITKISSIQVPTLDSIKTWVSDKIDGAKQYLTGMIADMKQLTSVDAVKDWVKNSKLFQDLVTAKDALINDIKGVWNNTLQNIYDASATTFSNPNGSWTSHIVGLDTSGTWYSLKGGDITTGEWAKNLKPLIGRTIEFFGSLVEGMISSIIVHVKQLIENTIGAVKDIVGKAVNYVQGKISDLADAVGGALTHIANVLAGLKPDASAIDSTAPVQGVYGMLDINTEISTIRDRIQDIQDKFTSLGGSLAIC